MIVSYIWETVGFLTIIHAVWWLFNRWKAGKGDGAEQLDPVSRENFGRWQFEAVDGEGDAAEFSVCLLSKCPLLHKPGVV